MTLQQPSDSKKSVFQFLDRNSFGSDVRAVRGAVGDQHGFNSSIGILSVRTLSVTVYVVPGARFQFLDRNSFGSDDTPASLPCSNLPSVSIPRSEFFRFGLINSEVFTYTSKVSIPRSEFFRFGRTQRGERSVAISGFQFLDRNSFGSDYRYRQTPPLALMMFQFLDRNSFGSDPALPFLPNQSVVVSIPRSEFFRFGLDLNVWRQVGKVGFNSSIGILSVRTRIRGHSATWTRSRFNSSIGILSVRTQHRVLNVFQDRCFNSSIGILSVRTRRAVPSAARRSPGFNSSIGILSVRTCGSPVAAPPQYPRFNSSIGILSVRTFTALVNDDGGGSVSIPRSEFFRFGPWHKCVASARAVSFNSSIGILSVRTKPRTVP